MINEEEEREEKRNQRSSRKRRRPRRTTEFCRFLQPSVILKSLKAWPQERTFSWIEEYPRRAAYLQAHLWWKGSRQAKHHGLQWCHLSVPTVAWAEQRVASGGKISLWSCDVSTLTAKGRCVGTWATVSTSLKDRSPSMLLNSSWHTTREYILGEELSHHDIRFWLHTERSNVPR